MTSEQRKGRDLLVARGYSLKGAAALIGNFSQETGTQLFTGKRTVTDHGSQGIAQWLGARLQALVAFLAGHRLPFNSLEGQIDFVAHELETEYRTLDKELREGAMPLEALVAAVCWEYERPSASAANMPNRLKQAELVLEG